MLIPDKLDDLFEEIKNYKEVTVAEHGFAKDIEPGAALRALTEDLPEHLVQAMADNAEHLRQVFGIDDE